jgi:O-glycosyl hydrolase
LFLGLGVLQAAAQTVVAPDPAKPRQSFEGWGVSLCWWANGVGRWDPANRGRVATLIAHPDSGLGYTLFRYNIGGGDAPGHDHMRAYGDIPGYKAAETSPYDWTADAYQRQMIADLTARSGGSALAWEAFANSPPHWMTKSGCAAGSADGSDNLKPEYFDDFADYLTEVVRKFRDSWGITFRTVAPFNEPSARWWMQGKNQEGCGFLNDQPRMVKLLGESLKAKGLSTAVSVSDENSLAEAITSLGKFDDSAMSFVSQINAHSYNGKVRRKDFAAAAAPRGKRVWQSESGPLTWPGGDQMDVSLWMADVIIRDILDMRVNAWLDWQVIDGGVWGSIHADYEDQSALPNKRYFMHAGFSRFIRPGSTIIESGTDSVLAALVPETQSLVLVILNASNADRGYALDLSRFALSEPQVRHYRTSESEDLARQPDRTAGSGFISFSARARSINTIVARIPLATALRQGRSLRPEAWRRGGSPLPGEGAPGFRMEDGEGVRDARGRAAPKNP